MTSPIPTREKLEQQGLLLLEEWIRAKIGISYQGHRLSLLAMRVRPRVDALGLDGVQDYFRYLQFHPEKGVELKLLISRLTNNETFFFREQVQLDYLAQEFIPALLDKSPMVRILSAGCSSGEEPVSLAATLYQYHPHLLDKVDITGVDIDLDILTKARAARYGDNSFRGVDPLLVHRYFVNQQGVRSPKDFLAGKVSYRWGNLFDAVSLGPRQRYDIILCRNVMIYFDDDGRRRVADNLHEKLRPGGVFFVGLSETLSSISYRYEPHRTSSVVYYSRD